MFSIGPLLSSSPILAGASLGWTLGANDTANVFGTAIATRIITFKKAAWLCSIFVIVGAVTQGYAGISTVSNIISDQTIRLVVIASLAAALSTAIMTFLSIPVSTSQAMIGSVLGIGLATGNVNYDPLIKVVLCWVGTPIGSLFLAIIFYKVVGFLLDHLPMSMLTRDKFLWSGLLLVGIYGSYALGANNVTVVTGIYSGMIEGVSDFYLALVGAIAIAIGTLTFSKRVIFTVGSKVMPLDAFTAFVAVLSMSITVHIFAFVGAPVSTSQGIIGAILGIGLIRGKNTIRLSELKRIYMGWLLTPVLSLIFSSAAYAIFCR